MNKSVSTMVFIISMICFLLKSNMAQEITPKQLIPSEIVQAALIQTRDKYCRDTFMVKMFGKHYTSVNGEIIHELEEYFSVYPLGWHLENPFWDFTSLQFNWYYKLVNEIKFVSRMSYSGGMTTVTNYFKTNLHSDISLQRKYSSSYKMIRDFLTDFSNYSFVVIKQTNDNKSGITVIEYQPVKPGSKWHGKFYIDAKENVILKCVGTATGEGKEDDTITEKFSCEYTAKAGVLYPKRGLSFFGSVRNKPTNDLTIHKCYEFYHIWEVEDIIPITNDNREIIKDYKVYNDLLDNDNKWDIKITEHFKGKKDFRSRSLYYRNKFKELNTGEK